MRRPRAWTPVGQPFAPEYYQREWKTMRAVKPRQDGDLEVVYRDVTGRLDGYLYRDFVIALPEVPILKINGDTWMSMTPMEVQSQYMPLLFAQGDVGVAGLGLGYAVQRILSKPDVDRVTVWEVDERVIALYLDTFGPHPKLKVEHGDVRESQGGAFDFFYNDVYPVIADDAIWQDWADLIQMHSIQQYHAWGMETFLWAFATAGRYGDLPFWMRECYRRFFAALLKSGRMLEHYADKCPPHETLDVWEQTGLAAEWGL